MRNVFLLAGTVLLMACGGPGGGGGTVTYRVEFAGSLNQGASFTGSYATQTGQAELFATALPASKEFLAGASDYVLASGSVSGGGTVTAKAFKNGVLCEEKTLAITNIGSITAACNKP